MWSIGAQGEHYTVPLFVSAFTSDAAQGRLRVVNPTGESGTVQITAIDDSGFRFSSATFPLNAWAAVEFEPEDFSSGNTAKGLSNNLGIGDGHFRLLLDADIPIEPSAYVRAPDGTISAMHDTVRAVAADGSGGFTYDVSVFNPSTEVTHVSRLRLINPGDTAAAATIAGRDDSGAQATGGDVKLTIAAGGAQTLTAQQLEAGDTAVIGQLGAGTGKWRLTVSSDQPLEVVNIVTSTAGYWNNLSTTAVSGAAPTGLEAFNERFIGRSVVYEISSGRFTLNAMGGERFTETTQADDVTEAFMGRYSYAGIGPDAGQLTLAYDDGHTCRANLYFSTRTSGWFASRCTGSDEPDGYWIGGSWFVEGSVDEEGDGEVDRFPSFRTAVAPGNQSYAVDTAIDALTLPAGTGGDGDLTYSLSPTVPGLTFDAGTRRLSGTPSTAGTYSMTYAVADEDGDTDSLGFTIAVSEATPAEGSLGVCHVGMMLSSGQSCTYPGTADEFSVNTRGRGSFLDRLAGIRIRISNETIDGRIYDFEASHRGDGVWRIDRIAGSTEPGTDGGPGTGETGTDTSPSFTEGSGPGDRTYAVGTAIDTLTLPGASGGDGTLTYTLTPEVAGLTFNAGTRQLTGTPTTTGTYSMTYTATDEDDDTDTLSFTITVVDVGNGDPISIPDAVLRSAIEVQLGKAQGAPIYRTEMQSLKSLDPGWLNEIGGIRDLAGLQFATNLEELSLRSNAVVSTPDLSPLAGLTKLTRLNLHAFNNIEDPSPLDLAPLAGLVNLSWLDLGVNNVSDISALKGLTGLAWLSIQGNHVSDISALSSMSVLEQFYGQDNKIARIESLRGLTQLRTVVLSSNEISDLAPLAENPGLASGDSVDVRNNPLSNTSTGIHLPNLRARGVDVRYSEIVEFENPQIYNDNVFVIPVTEPMTEINAHLNRYVDRVLDRFGDVFDFVIFVPNRNMPPAYFAFQRNSAMGIGLPIRITGRQLQGVINMGGRSVHPSDLEDRGVSIIRAGPLLHEIMHRWANFVVPTSYGSHWGFSSANGSLGGFDIADLVDHGGGRYSAGRVAVGGAAANTTPYAPIELYLAGLVPPQDVPDIWVAEDGAFLYDGDGVSVYDDRGYPIFTASRVSTYTIDDIIAEHGARVPDSLNSQREFRAVVVLLVNEKSPATRELLDVVSRDVDWFGHDGIDEFPSIFNFHEATGGRATITVDGLGQLALDNG